MLSVIIVNYNVKYFLEQCLFSVFKAGKGIAMEVIVVDNNSTDGSAQYIQSIFTRVRYHVSQKNLGFAKACNYGLKLSLGSHILFLNPDTILPEDSLVKCIHFLDTHTNTGALGVRMLDGSGNFLKESKRGNPTVMNSFFKLSGLSSLFPGSKSLSGYHLGHLDEHQTHPVDILSGAFMMMHKRTLDLTGGFDEQFFMYGEDIDLSYRIQKAGYHNYYFPEVSIIHFKGESTAKKSFRYVMDFYKAMGIFERKHYKDSIGVVYRFFIETAIFLIAVFSLLYKIASQIFDGVYNFLAGGKATLFKKNQVLLLSGSQEATTAARQIVESTGIKVSISNETLAGITNNCPVILCEDDELSFKRIIHLLDEQKRTNAMIYANGSRSIVGSPGKNKAGKTIPH